MLAPPPFVTVPEKVTSVPVVNVPDASTGVPLVRSTVAVALTDTAVHAPQLFTSFDSVIVPDDAAEFLSAHARTYHVAAEGKVYESVAVVFALAASAEAL